MNSPSPLVPQGAIPPKNTSRSARVLLIAFSVVFLHVAGLGVVLMQGCQKDANKAGGTASAETNYNSNLSLPPLDTNNVANASSYYTSASNLPASATTSIPATNPVSIASPMVGSSAPVGTGLGTPVAPATGIGLTEPPIGTAETPVGETKDYKVVSRDTLSGIAARNKITLGTLLKANPDLDPKKLRIGQTIKVPVTPATATASVGATGAAGTPAAHATGGGTYKVKSGDTLTRIAKAHGISVNELRAANNMKTTQLLAGRVLKIPARTQNSATAPATTTTQH